MSEAKPDAAREQAYADFLHFKRLTHDADWKTAATLAQAAATNRLAFLLAHHEPQPRLVEELSANRVLLSRLAAAATKLTEFPNSDVRVKAVTDILNEILDSEIDNRIKQQ